MIYFNNIKLILFSLFKLIVIIIFLFIVIPKVYCIIYNNNSDVCSKKPLNYQTIINQQLKQLTQISDAHSQCLIQLQQQLSDNQQDLDVLRGHIQNIQHHIAEIINSQKESHQKISQILNKNSNIKLFGDNAKQLPNIDNLKIDLYNNNNVKKNVINPMDSDYKLAVELVLEKKQYVQAIQAFQSFITKYPKSHYQANAHYWLGQLYYNQGNKHDASYYFALVVKNYAKSSKASDALLKIGIIMQETNQIDKAKTIYRQVGKLYPNSDASKQAQKRLLRLS